MPKDSKILQIYDREENEWHWCSSGDDDTLIDDIHESEKMATKCLQYSEDNYWWYYQQETRLQNHNISTLFRIKKLYCIHCGHKTGDL